MAENEVLCKRDNCNHSAQSHYDDINGCTIPDCHCIKFMEKAWSELSYEEQYRLQGGIDNKGRRMLRPLRDLNYKREDKNIHTSDGPRYCSLCSQKFSNRDDYLKHHFESHGCSDL